MKPIYQLLAICLLSLSISSSFAQSDTSKTDKAFGLKTGINFLSNDVYLGRTDTVSTPTISPVIGYTFKSGVFFTGTFDYITNRKKNNLDNGSIEAGYNYTRNDNFEFGGSFSKLFYNSNSTQVSSSISSILNIYADYDIAGIITPTISVNYNIGKKGGNGGDLILNPSLSHEFEIDGLFNEDAELTINPEAGLNFGSQNYYAGYLEKKNRISKRVANAANAAYNSYYSALGDSKLLDYELSIPIEYKLNSFRFKITPTYAFGQNSLPQSTEAEKLITKSVETNLPYKPSVFYIEVGVALKF